MLSNLSFTPTSTRQSAFTTLRHRRPVRRLAALVPWALLLVATALLVAPLAAETSAVSPPPGIGTACAQIVGGPCEVIDSERADLVDGIALYTYRLEVGPGVHDRVALYRIVAESSPGDPVAAPRGVFLAHGDRWPFEATYLSSLRTSEVPDEQALPIFLAQNGIDVWGMDFRWALVPGTVTDTSFMFDWGLLQDASDLRLGTAVARFVRATTGSGYSKLAVGGFSRGAQAAYVMAAHETQLPPGLRQADALVPIDMTVAFDDPAATARACQRHAEQQARLDQGMAAFSTDIFQLVVDLALTAPDEPSPIYPVRTNRDLILDSHGFARPDDIVPFFHTAGVLYDADDVPLQYLYSNESLLFQWVRGAAIHEPIRVFAEGEGLLCDTVELPPEEHFGDIDVPVFYLGAGGGIGDFGIYATTRLATTDVTTNVYTVTSDRPTDVGHIDLLMADDAEYQAWQPLLTWLQGLP